MGEEEERGGEEVEQKLPVLLFPRSRLIANTYFKTFFN
jgi:hypothetical protein